MHDGLIAVALLMRNWASETQYTQAAIKVLYAVMLSELAGAVERQEGAPVA